MINLTKEGEMNRRNRGKAWEQGLFSPLPEPFRVFNRLCGPVSWPAMLIHHCSVIVAHIPTFLSDWSLRLLPANLCPDTPYSCTPTVHSLVLLVLIGVLWLITVGYQGFVCLGEMIWCLFDKETRIHHYHNCQHNDRCHHHHHSHNHYQLL